MKKWITLFYFAISLYGNPIDELKAKVVEELPNLHGWCSREKALAFIDLVLEVKPTLCVEIGVFGGRSLLPVASALKFLNQGIVVGIDPWNREAALANLDPVRDQVHMSWWSKINLEQVYSSCLDMISRHHLEDYVVILRTTSEQASHALAPIDILYIDGHHSETLSNLDVQMYLPKVRSGGYIWFNDSLWSDLQSSVDLLFETSDFVRIIDGGNCILLRKK